MTLTEEQRGTVGFDLEKARAGISHYRIENPSNVDTESALKELVDQANLAEDALAEIERLRAALAESEKIVEHKSKSATHWYDEHLRAQTDLTQSKRVIEQQVARIEELESSLGEAEALTKKNAETMNGYLARITELEDALVEGLTNFLHYRASCYDPARRCPYAKECDDCSTWDACGHVEKFRSEARQQLQAEGKIGNSEHFTEPTKMIGFDLEKARAVDIDLLAATDWGELRGHYRAALAEIERLRPFEIAARDLDSDLTKIAGERDDQAARIKELEDALTEERAKYNLSWKDCAYRAPDTYCEKTHNYCTSEDCPLLDEQKTEARRQLRAEGKIGPDAKPRSWQITDERIGLLEYCLETLLDAPDIEEIPGPGHSIEMLRAMLREAE